MAIANLSNIDDKLTKMYENQVTTNVSSANFEDKSDILFAQMNFIAMNNKSFITYRTKAA